MNNKGYILIDRRIRDHWIWKDPVKFKWWIDIVLDVNYKPDHFNVDGKLILCGRGQSVKSLHSWAQKWGVNRNVARKFFRLLTKKGMISMENMKRTTRLTVLDYDKDQYSVTQLTLSESESNKDSVPNPYPTFVKKQTQLTLSESESNKDAVPNFEEILYPNRSNEEVFNQENSFEKKSSSKKNLDKEFEMFTESDEAKKLMFSPDKKTPYDPTH